MSNPDSRKPALQPHVALLPSSGMGHLTPFLRFAVLLSKHNVRVTIITAHPTVSLSETQTLSQFFTAFPQITPKQLHLLPLNNSSVNSEDPFYVQYEAIRLSSHLLTPILSSSSPPLSALVTDMSLASTVIPVTKALKLPNYILFTTSAQMLTLFVSFHTTIGSESPNESAEMKDFFRVGSLQPIPKSWVPPPLLSDRPNLLKAQITENGKEMIESDGILINTFQSIEHESLLALNGGKVINGLPQVTAIGPFPLCEFERRRRRSQPLLHWLDDQPVGSVVFVSFGSRTAMTREQIRELGDGLVRSGCRFLWVVKEKKVDREDEGELGEVVGEEFMNKVNGKKGLVVKSWVSQEEILGHQAVCGFLSHCGWNSVIEAVWHGVPLLAWPQHGDQKMNAHVVERIGLGIWVREWGWGGGEMVVKGEEIGEVVGKFMGNEFLKEKAVKIREEARKAVGDGGSSGKGLIELIETWKKPLVE